MRGASPQIRQPECESLAQQHDSAAPEKLRPDGRYDGRHADIRDQKAVAETDPQADQDGDDDAEPDLPRVYRRERKAESGYRQRRGETQIHLPRRDHQREARAPENRTGARLKADSRTWATPETPARPSS